MAFGDFELASLWSIKTWTVLIFDAQTGGLALPETLRLAAGPLLIEGVVLAGLLWQLPRTQGALVRPATQQSPALPGAAWIYLTLAALGVTGLPLALVIGQSLSGWRAVAENFVLGNEVLASGLFAFGATSLAAFGARVSRRRSVGGGLGRWFWLGGPGLLGALVISLLILALFQWAPLRSAYDTPLPLLLALVILLLPLALLLDELLQTRVRQPGLHVARQVGSRALIRVLETRPRLGAAGLLSAGPILISRPPRCSRRWA